MKKFLLTLLICCFSILAFAQQDAQFTQYMFNRTYLNPAFTGSDGLWADASLLYRNQWTGYQPVAMPGIGTAKGGAPSTFLASVNMSLLKERMGIGLYLSDDRLGAVDRKEVQLSFAYHIPFKDSKLSLGLRTGLYSYRLDYGSLDFRDPSDPLGQDQRGAISEIKPDFAAGIYFQHPLLFAGASLGHLQQSEFSLGLPTPVYTLSMQAYGLLGVNLNRNGQVVWQPSVLVKSDMVSVSVEGSLLAYIHDKYYVGGALRDLDDVSLLLGMSLTKDNRLRLGYAFDYVVNEQSAKAMTSHELMLSFRFQTPGSKEPSVIRTPRFRY